MPAENENDYDRRSGPRDRGLRVGDREREAVSEILRRQHVDGRLDAVEFSERLERCLAAKTYADLDQLIADFPGREPEQGRARRARAGAWRPVAPLPLALIPLAAVIAAIVLSGGHLVWLAFPVFFFVLRPLLWRSWRHGYGRGPWGCAPRSSTRGESQM